MSEEIRAPFSDAGETSSKQESGKGDGDTHVVGNVAEVGVVLKIEAHEEAREIVVVKDDDEADQGWSEVPTVASDLPKCLEPDDRDDSDITDVKYEPVVDTTADKVIKMKSIQYGKEFSAPAVFDSVDTDDFTTLEGAPWFDI